MEQVGKIIAAIPETVTTALQINVPPPKAMTLPNIRLNGSSSKTVTAKIDTSSGSLESGTYTIKVLSTNYSIGRRRVENRSLLPKQIIASYAPSSQSSRWVVKAREDGRYKLSVGNGHTGPAQGDKLVAYLIKEDEIEDWIVTSRPQHGDGVFTIEKPDRSAAWTVTEEQVQQDGSFKIVKVLPLISTRSSPPKINEYQLFKFASTSGLPQLSPISKKMSSPARNPSTPLSNGTYAIKTKDTNQEIGRDPTPDRSALTRKIQTLSKTYADTPRWELKGLSGDSYRLTIGGFWVGADSNNRVVAYQKEEERQDAEDWIITAQPQHGNNVYTVEKSDHSLGWTLGEGAASEGGKLISVGLVISTRSIPPQYRPNQLFEFVKQ
ncbi:hypothetical protein TWF696_003477 [Orbilia brochopaga]|uniref:Uncharacterized protein n=1 Tax=Orbilia brochopaga TaxID=3140254 RepID=A0AAV9TZL9_9PEZI